MIVVDANIIAYLLISGDRTPEAQALWRFDNDWVVPDLWRDEFLNILSTYVRQGGADLETAKKLWGSAVDLFASKERSANPLLVLELAQQYRLSAYDAQYLAVALELGVMLLTEDRSFHRAVPQFSTTMQPYLQAS